MLVLIRSGWTVILISVAQHSLKVKLISSLVIHCHVDDIHKRSVDKTAGDTELVVDPNAYTCLTVNNDIPLII